jgi:DNA polymerase (family 10)
VAGRTEEEVFALVGMPFIPPELREASGEIEAALAGKLPRLIELGDVRGDLQMHTTATDGRASALEMARAARALGREYIAITEHSQAVSVTGGLDDAEILAHRAALRRLSVPGLRILAGVEVDIHRDGSLDLRPETLRRLDLVVGSVHTYLSLPRDEMTRRVLRAVESGSIHVLGHPTGRLLGEREPSEIDIKAVIEACVRHGVVLEINAHPERLDLSDAHARLAKELGAKLVISTDAHSPEELKLLRWGVGVARRAWLTKSDVLNTLPVDKFLGVLQAGIGRR